MSYPGTRPVGQEMTREDEEIRADHHEPEPWEDPFDGDDDTAETEPTEEECETL